MADTGKIILGTVQFGLPYGINNQAGKPGQETVFEILNQAYDSGIRILDTAEVYGNAHDLIGSFHKRNPGKQFDVISKLPDEFGGMLDQKITGYISQLHIDQLKALLFHSYDSYKVNRALLTENSNTGITKGVELIGVSVYTNDQFSKVIEDELIDIIQLPFNLFDNCNLRGDLIAKAKRKGKIIHTRSAFLQGLFFIEEENAIARALRNEIRFIRKIAADLQISVNTLALNYCLQQKNIDNVLIGVETTQQIEQNLKEIHIEIPASYIDQINSIFITNPDLLNPSKWN